jgi:hypothetical protein
LYLAAAAAATGLLALLLLLPEVQQVLEPPQVVQLELRG